MRTLPLPSPPDPLDALVACHGRIRMFTTGILRIAELPDLADPRIPPAAEQAARYFRLGLPLHARDEDESLAPRLRVSAPATAPLLDALEADHRTLEGLLTRLVPQLEALAAGAPVVREAFVQVVNDLCTLLLAHIATEETYLFPAMAMLDTDARAAIAAEFVARRQS